MDKTSDSSLCTPKRSGWPIRAIMLIVTCAVALCVFAQPAQAALQRSWTAEGFFEYVFETTDGAAHTDAKGAISILGNSASSSVAGIASYTSIGNEYDASSLYNLYAGLSYLDYCNSIRGSRGLAAFGTNCTIQAMSIVMCNYSQRFGGHSNAYFAVGVHEALAWGGGSRSAENVYQSWYYSEGDGGSHRRNVIGSYNISGLAIAQRGSGTMAHMYEQSFQSASAGTKIYSISEFRQLLKTYISKCLAEGMPMGSLPSGEFAGLTATKQGLVTENGVVHGYSNGTMIVNGWGQFGGAWYHFDGNGALQTNAWVSSGGVWYWLGANGAMATNTWVSYGGKWYWLTGSGALATSAWVEYGGSWYWLGSSGAMASSTWVRSGGKWYYLGSNGAMASNTWIYSGGKWYCLGTDGAMLANSWSMYDGVWYYLGSNGALLTNSWLKYDGSWYWFGSDGALYVDKWLSWNGSWYYLGADGKAVSS